MRSWMTRQLLLGFLVLTCWPQHEPVGAQGGGVVISVPPRPPAPGPSQAPLPQGSSRVLATGPQHP
jgi:hypothetical protein